MIMIMKMMFAKRLLVVGCFYGCGGVAVCAALIAVVVPIIIVINNNNSIALVVLLITNQSEFTLPCFALLCCQ